MKPAQARRKASSVSGGGEEADDEEDADVPEDLADLPPEVQQRRIFQRSLKLMGAFAWLHNKVESNETAGSPVELKWVSSIAS